MICNKCKERITTADQQEDTRPFPAFTVLAGIAGAAGAALTGTILAIPAAIMAGAAVDISQRCEICDSDEPAYHLMEESNNESGGQSYKPVGNSAGLPQANTQRPSQRQSLSSLQSPERTQEANPVIPPDMLQESDEQQQQAQHEYVFDEIQGMLIQRDIPSDEDATNINLTEGFSNDADVTFEVPDAFGLENEPTVENTDPFFDFQDDTSIDTEPFGPVDDPSVGGF